MHLPMINYTGQVNCGSECLLLNPFISLGQSSCAHDKMDPLLKGCEMMKALKKKKPLQSGL